LDVTPVSNVLKANHMLTSGIWIAEYSHDRWLCTAPQVWRQSTLGPARKMDCLEDITLEGVDPLAHDEVPVSAVATLQHPAQSTEVISNFAFLPLVAGSLPVCCLSDILG